MRNVKPVLSGLALSLCGCLAHATVTDVVNSAAAGASSVATKTERAVKRGVNAGISGVERGTKAAGHAIDSTAKKIGVPGAGASSASHSSPPRGEMPTR